jgi:glycosyltransferase involved in cell wall biosynthesis
VKGVQRICFVSPYGYAVLLGSQDIPFVGGAEVQQVLIASQLARRGHYVSMISFDFGQTEGIHQSGVRLLKMMPPRAGLPGFRFFHPWLTSLWSAMRRADADVYYQRCAGATTGAVAAFASWLRKGSVFAGASDSDFDPNLPRIRLLRDRLMFKYGVRRVNQVVVQSERQRQMCRTAFGRDAVRISSCYDFKGGSASHEGPIIWVGNIRAVKRPELFVEVARRLPQHRFVLIGGTNDHSVDFGVLRRQAHNIANLSFTGHLPVADVESHFDGASVLVNTSATEGFPNTFLQAWSRGMPTVSFFDSGAREKGEDVGRVVDGVEAMVDAIDAYKRSPPLWREDGARAAEHYRGNFSVARSIDDYERVFGDAIERTQADTP